MQRSPEGHDDALARAAETFLEEGSCGGAGRPGYFGDAMASVAIAIRDRFSDGSPKAAELSTLRMAQEASRFVERMVAHSCRDARSGHHAASTLADALEVAVEQGGQQLSPVTMALTLAFSEELLRASDGNGVLSLETPGDLISGIRRWLEGQMGDARMTVTRALSEPLGSNAPCET